LACFGYVLLKIYFAKNLQNKKKRPIFDIVNMIQNKTKIKIMKTTLNYPANTTLKNKTIGNFFYTVDYCLFKLLNKTPHNCEIQTYYFDREKMKYVKSKKTCFVHINFQCIDIYNMKPSCKIALQESKFFGFKYLKSFINSAETFDSHFVAHITLIKEQDVRDHLNK